jgi:hypothetical protein
MLASAREEGICPAMPAPATSGRVFISYRRQDARGSAGRIYDRLADRFGDDQVFMDVDNLPPGADFAQVIAQAVSTCQVLLAIIGPRWLTATDEDGRRRLDDPDDIVHLEIAAALERDILVIPILVEDAAMPRRQQLPENLVELAGRNVYMVRHGSFRSDTDRLLAAIDLILRRAAAAPPVAPDLGREFRLGPLHVPVRILEGNGEHAIDESNVRVLVNPVDVQLPDELAEWRAEIAAEQDRRREVSERPA